MPPMPGMRAPRAPAPGQQGAYTYDAPPPQGMQPPMFGQYSSPPQFGADPYGGGNAYAPSPWGAPQGDPSSGYGQVNYGSPSPQDMTARKSLRRSLYSNMKQDLNEQHLPLITKIIYCMPTVSTLPIVVLLAAFGNSLYELCGAELSMISACIAAARSMDVITDPGMSYITDAAHTRWGRRRPFMLSGAPVYGMMLIALLTPPHGSSNYVAAWFAMTYIGFFVTNTYCNIPYDALGPELTDNYEDRSNLFFISGLFDGGGTLVACGMPTMMTMFARKSTRNDKICKPEGDEKNIDIKCQQGNTCEKFIEDKSKTFVPDDEYSEEQRVWLIAQNLTSLVNTCEIPANIQNSYVDLTTAQKNFCMCRRDCASACALANMRTGFMGVGTAFGIWYILTIALCVFKIKERSQVEKGVMEKAEAYKPESGYSQPPSSGRASISTTTGTKEKNPPIVPMILSTFFNKAFVVLLPAWACDGLTAAVFASLVTYYIRYVIQPEYQTEEEHGRDCQKGVNAMSSSDNFSHFCSTPSVLAMCLLAALMAAVATTPIWLYLVKRIGKVKTWLLWSLVMAVTNILFVFPGKGHIWFCMFVCGANGVPMSAKFLADAILSDIIDYDEFLTGSRREATYTMFKSFLPKIMAIPAAAIPISLMNAVGHKKPENGMIQEQPAMVGIYLKLTGGVLTSLVSILAWYQKRKFPLVTKEQVDLVAEGVSAHLIGQPAVDPVSKRMFALTKFEDDELDQVWTLDHFMGSYVIAKLMEGVDEACNDLKDRTKKKFIGALVFVAFIFITTIIMVGPLDLMNDAKLSFLPTLAIVIVGGAVVYSVFVRLQLNAANKLVENPPSMELVAKVYKQRLDFEALQYIEGQDDAKIEKDRLELLTKTHHNTAKVAALSPIQIKPVGKGYSNFTDKE